MCGGPTAHSGRTGGRRAADRAGGIADRRTPSGGAAGHRAGERYLRCLRWPLFTTWPALAPLPASSCNAVNLSGPASVPFAPSVLSERAVGAIGSVRASRWRHRFAAGRREPVLMWQLVRAGQPVARPGSPGHRRCALSRRADTSATIKRRAYPHTTANQPQRLRLTALPRGDACSCR